MNKMKLEVVTFDIRIYEKKYIYCLQLCLVFQFLVYQICGLTKIINNPGPTKAQIAPVSTDNQQLEKRQTIRKLVCHLLKSAYWSFIKSIQMDRSQREDSLRLGWFWK